MNLNEYIQGNKAGIMETFDTLHAMPEIAMTEEKTGAYLDGQLKKAGYAVRRVAGTGVLGVLDSGAPGPVVAARADMDALLHEVDGVQAPVHSCGHDANCTAVLWAAKALSQAGAPKRGSLRILFQPAEEALHGARECIKAGALDGAQYLVGTHLRPIEELPMGKMSPAVLHGASGGLYVTIHGENAHGARPHQGVNAIEAAVAVISAVSALHLDPTIIHTAKPTQIKSVGNPFNMIPHKVELTFDLRAQENALMQRQIEAVCDRAVRAAQSYGAKAECVWNGGAPAATRCDELIRIASDVIGEVMGAKGLGNVIVTSGGEDFHEYPLAIPGLKSTVLGVGAGLIPGLHKPEMRFNHDALIYSAQVMAALLERLLLQD